MRIIKKHIRRPYIILLYFALLLFTGCSKEETDEALLQKDEATLQKSLTSDLILRYKFLKICLRSSAEKDTLNPQLKSYKTSLQKVSNAILNYDSSHLSLVDYITLYRDYRNMSQFIASTDEDIFPTFRDLWTFTYSDSTNKYQLLKGQKKVEMQNIEHAFFSALAILGKGLGDDIALYECSKTNPDLILEGEIKSLLQFYRGAVFFQKNMYYLSEKQITLNIDWLNKNPSVPFPFTQKIFRWNDLTNEQTFTGFRASNYLFRGLDRLMMEREIDEKRANSDLEQFLEDTRKLGLRNEMVLAVEAYLYIKQEEKEKAIAALNGLKESPLISDNDKNTIDESIKYLVKREKGTKLNKIYDKHFIAKIILSYTTHQMAHTNWQALVAEQQMPHTSEMLQALQNFKSLATGFEKYQITEPVTEAQRKIKDKGTQLMDKAAAVFKK